MVRVSTRCGGGGRGEKSGTARSFHAALMGMAFFVELDAPWDRVGCPRFFAHFRTKTVTEVAAAS
jgi:hypothetical protein